MNLRLSFCSILISFFLYEGFAQNVAPKVTSPVNYCLGSPAVPLTAEGTNLMWTSTVSSSVGGLEKLTASTTYIDNTYSNRRTLFTTSVANVKITSIDFTIAAWQAVNGVKIGIFNSDGTVLLASSTTTTSKTAGSTAVTVTNTFNYTIASAGTYSIGLVSGSGNFGTEAFSAVIGASPVTISGTSSGQRAFSNINYTASITSSTAPTPSTAVAGSTDYYVTQNVNNVTSKSATITVNVNATPAPTVTSPVNLCQGSIASALSASGTNLVWTNTISGSLGGSAVRNSGSYVSNESTGRTFFTTAVPNVTITSLDYYLYPYNAVNGLVLGIYNSEGTLLATSTTNTTQSAGSVAVKITNSFNYTLLSAGTYSIGVVSGSGNIGMDYSSTTYPITEPTATVSITSNTFSGNIFNNIQFSVTTVSSSTAPVPSTTYVGATTYYVTQTVNGCTSPPATVIVNVKGITSTTSGTGCSGSSVTLNATASPGYTINWFDSSSGGNAKGTGASFTTPALTSSKTYYVSATDGSCTTTRIPVLAIIGGFTWVGNNSSSFSNSANWSSCTNTAPATSGTAEIIIPQSTTNTLTLESDLTLNSLTLQGNSKLNLNGYTLTVSSISGTGFIIGSKSSKLILGGTSDLSLRFDQSTPGQTNFLKSLTINGNSRKVILENALIISDVVNITGSSTLNSNGNLTLESTKNSIASIGPLLNGGSVVGNVRVQTFMSGSSQYFRNFRTITSPVNDISSPSRAYRIAGYKSTMLITGPGGIANGFDPSPNNGSTIKYYNEAKKNSEVQYIYPTNAITEAIPQGTGIYFFYRGNKDNSNSKFTKVNGSYATPEDVVMEYYGEINSGNISPALSYTNHPGEDSSNGFNLIGNPYPCTIDWNGAGVVKNKLDNTIWVQKQNGTFAILKGDVSTNGGSRYILPGQGFFIKANGANPSVVFTESAKVSSVTPPERLLSKGESERLSFAAGKASNSLLFEASSITQKLNIQMVKDEFANDETAIVLNETSSNLLDEDDILYQGEGAVTLTTVTPDNKYLAINYTPQANQVAEVSLYATASESGTYTLRISDNSIQSAYGVFLKDSYLNTTVDLSAQQSYQFTIDKAKAASFGSARFKLLVQPITTLPLKLISFTAQRSNVGVELKWKSEGSAGTEKFEVEHSFNGDLFYTIAAVKVGAESQITFNYTDKEADPGENYYRLKQINTDGSYTYSKIISVNLATVDLALNLYPNPTVKEIKVKLASNATGDYTLSVFNQRGIKILSGRGLTLDVTSLTNGVYIVEVADRSGNVVIGRSRFIKN